jgi:hypothetical protein
MNNSFVKVLAYSNANTFNPEKTKYYAQTVRTGTFEASTSKKETMQ